MPETLNIPMADLAEAPAQRNKVLWFTLPILIPIVVLPALILVATPREYMLGSLLAYLNLLMCGAAMVHFARLRTLEGLVPILFLAWLVLGWPVASIYYASFFPDAEYGLMAWTVKSLSGYVRLQSVLFLFLFFYLLTVCMLIRRPTTRTQMHVSAQTARRVALFIFWCSVPIIGFNIFSKVTQLPFLLGYVADGLMIYFDGMLFVVGAYYVYLSKSTKIMILMFMLSCGFFYTLGNSRGMAMRPFVMFLLGLLFCADLGQKWKVTIIAILLMLLPLYMVIGNTTRNTKLGGGFTNLSQRYEALTQWQEVAAGQSFMATTLGRFFYTGGHAMITMTPEQYDYLPFSLYEFTTEFLGRLIPGKLYYKSYYSSTYLLLRYGFRINEGTSVELSLVGSLWVLGGPIFVIAGAVLTALTHGWVGRLLRRARQVSPHKALFFMSVLGTFILFSPNTDFINNFRNLVWHTLFATIFYHLTIHWIVRGETEETVSSYGHETYATSPA